MRVLLSATRRHSLTYPLMALVVPALLFAACDSTVAPEASVTTEPEDAVVLGKVEKQAVCHIGNELPFYDPACTDGCGDARKIDLIMVSPKAA